MISKKTSRGFTMLEVMVAIGVFVIVTAAAFVFARSQIRMRKQTQLLLDTEQNARVALDSIRFDLQTSGLGVGYTLGAVFSGVTMGPFGPFESNEHSHAPLAFTSDDLRIRGATGPVRTISEYFAPNITGSMQICAGGGFRSGDIVLIVSESYADARAITLSADPLPEACGEGYCETGCERATFTDASATYETDGNARFASYQGGSAFKGFLDVTYFIEWNGTTPALYRAEGPCATRAVCANQQNNLLGEGVESLQVRVLELDPAVAAPRDVTTDPSYNDPTLGGGVKSENRVRVDVEVIAQSRAEESDAPPNRICSTINPALCFPALGGTPDRFRRRKLMTSVELKNSGHMRFQALR